MEMKHTYSHYAGDNGDADSATVVSLIQGDVILAIITREYEVWASSRCKKDMQTWTTHRIILQAAVTIFAVSTNQLGFCNLVESQYFIQYTVLLRAQPTNQPKKSRIYRLFRWTKIPRTLFCIFGFFLSTRQVSMKYIFTFLCNDAIEELSIQGILYLIKFHNRHVIFF